MLKVYFCSRLVTAWFIKLFNLLLMKNIISLTLSLLFSFVIFQSGYAQANNFITALEQYLSVLEKDNPHFGLSIAVAQKDKLVFQKAYGLANRNYELPVTTKTKFNIASIGKMMTAIAILQLEQDKALNLQEKLGTYFPDFPHEGIRDSVSIHQLLTHTSGLPIWFTPDFPLISKFQYEDLKDYVPLFKKLKIDTAKVDTYSYSNVGYFVLGCLIEKIAGVPYAYFVSENISLPLGMRDTEFYSLNEIKKVAAEGYMRPTKDGEAWQRNDRFNLASGPAGGAYATPSDLVRLFLGLRNHQLLTPENTKLMMEEKVKTPQGGYGYGIGQTSYNDHPILGHLGGFFGARGELMWYQTADYTIAILANSDQTDYIDVSHFIEVYLAGTATQQEAHTQTLNLLQQVLDQKIDISTAETKAQLAKGTYDSDLLQIKGYFYLNKNDFTPALAIFQLNALLFPTDGTQNDLRRAVARTKSQEAWKKW